MTTGNVLANEDESEAHAGAEMLVIGGILAMSFCWSEFLVNGVNII